MSPESYIPMHTIASIDTKMKGPDLEYRLKSELKYSDFQAKELTLKFTLDCFVVVLGISCGCIGFSLKGAILP